LIQAFTEHRRREVLEPLRQARIAPLGFKLVRVGC